MSDFYNVLISYDIESNHKKVRDTLIQDYGFEEVVTGTTENNSPITCYLPNTTLYKKNTTKKSALKTLQDVCRAFNSNLKRAISLECSNWHALRGEEF